MSAEARFDPDARAEYLAALDFYATASASLEVAERFAAEVGAALAAICVTPELWRIVGPPEIRRYVLRHFPYVLYYRYDSAENVVMVYAVMHTSRRPGYWRESPSL